MTTDTPEHRRLEQALSDGASWYRWGPYLSERQWGTVREDYSANGDAWNYLTHDLSRSRAYRWGEDGLLGICDDRGYLCFALTLWNGIDPILKERAFGLSNSEGNHGEDVKEYYYFLDSTPTHSYMRGLFKYPQRAYPYQALVEENARRSKLDPEYELLDTGVFADNRYFDVTVEYAKESPDDILIRISAVNRGPDSAQLHLLPTLWFRNTWSWGRDDGRPQISCAPPSGAVDMRLLRADHPVLGTRWLACEGSPELLFTESESNDERLWEQPDRTPYVKDAFHRYLADGERCAINPSAVGTKTAVHFILTIPGDGAHTIHLRLCADGPSAPPQAETDAFARLSREADLFYAPLVANLPSADAGLVFRQAMAGLLWSKQLYHYDIREWLDGDPAEPQPPAERLSGRNSGWWHLNNDDVMSMPDTWEYPWYAAWDLAFHCATLALVDAQLAKRQLILLLREWYMHPNGQIPAYEWDFSDVNPPVHTWAALEVYRIDKQLTGRADRDFLERAFHKLMLHFTWWVNRLDREGRNVFQGGFLGLDNIGVFNRSSALPMGGYLEQADGTAWMGMFCLDMLSMALELACEDSAYEDVATKFFEHFMYIAGALNNLGGDVPLWNERDQFFYDVLHLPDGSQVPLEVRSIVGLIPLLAVTTVDSRLLDRLPDFRARMDWFLTHRPDLAALVSHWYEPGEGETQLLALVHGHRMKRLLARMLDPGEFLSDHGIRSMSKAHETHPYTFEAGGSVYSVDYEPAESRTGLFGGNSNWRGPVWFPLNFLLIGALRRFHAYYSDDFLIEFPTGSGVHHNLRFVADDLSARLTGIFARNDEGRRIVFGSSETMQTDPQWRDNLLFFEYFHGDTGAGLGASHQTGWTALVARLLGNSVVEGVPAGAAR